MIGMSTLKVFCVEYLRAPNEEDTKRLMAKNAKQGWHDMLGSLDCMHWRWKNCHAAWPGCTSVIIMIQE
jgi:hypothetical protein